MPRLFLGNFDFEHELASQLPGATKGRQMPRGAQQTAASLASIWLGLSEPQDAILTANPPDVADFSELLALGMPPPRFVTSVQDVERGPATELVPWGWTSYCVELARQQGWRAAAPPVDVVRMVNSRVFRLALEQEWNIALAGAQAVSNLDELSAVVTARGESPRGWVLKAEFGMSGRERILGRGSQLAPQVAGWATRRFSQGQGIVFEPWVERIDEAGIQVAIPAEGEPEFLGVTPLLCDPSGVYRGNRCGTDPGDAVRWQPAVEVALCVARRLQSCGYFGPLGIDAMWYRDDSGTPQLRPLQDLNARYTMGRISLGFRRLLAPGQQAAWLHFPQANSGETGPTLKQLQEKLATCARLVLTSPSSQGGREVSHGSALLIADSLAALDNAEAEFFRGIRN